MKFTKIDLPFETVAAFARLSKAIGNPTEVESDHEHVETELLDRALSRIAKLETALRDVRGEIEAYSGLRAEYQDWSDAFEVINSVL